MTRAMTGAVTTPPRAPLRHGRLSAPPPPQKHHRVAPSCSHFCPLSRPLSRRARGRVSGTPIIRPSVRMTAHCAHAAHTPPPRPRARASETETAQRRHSDTTTRRRQLGVAGRSRSAAPGRGLARGGAAATEIRRRTEPGTGGVPGGCYGPLLT